MLTEEEKDIIKSTIPVLEEHGAEITSTFYKNMFEAHPELLNMFNQTNQKVGDQPKALANTVLAAARHIDDLEAIVPSVIGIGHKHRALNVFPEHYPIVGKYLMTGIKDVLGDAATPEIISAWEKYYDEIAQVFIDVEKEMYHNATWEGFKTFEVVKKEMLTDNIVRFTVDTDSKLPIIQPGQYITVKVNPKDYPYEALRHYSICTTDTSNGLQSAVKREGEEDEAGVVSHFMFDELQEGDEIELSAPAGDFLLEDEDPLLFLAAGVGLTPIMSMVEQSVKDNKDIKMIVSVRSEADLPFKKELDNLKDKIDLTVHYSNDLGRLSAKDLEGYEDRAVYLSGSMGFNQTMIDALESLGYDIDDVHYEPFGPKMSLVV